MLKESEAFWATLGSDPSPRQRGGSETAGKCGTPSPKRFRDYCLGKKSPPEAPSDPPACQSSTSSPPLPDSEDISFSPYAAGLTDWDEVDVEIFPNGSRRVSWPLEGPEIVPEDFEELDCRSVVRRDRDRLKASNQQSKKSRLRAAWTLSASPVSWAHMVTLTYRPPHFPSDYEGVSDHRKRFTKRLLKSFPDSDVAWILEFTRRKVPHFHLFIAGEVSRRLSQEPVTVRNGQRFDGITRDRITCSGPTADRIVQWWTNQAGDGSEEFQRFQSGGIVEVITNPEGAGKYVAKEAGKRDQKHGPFLVWKWWGISDRARPVSTHSVKMTVGDYVAIYGPKMMRHLF